MADPKRPLFHIIPLDERDLPGTDDESDDAGQPRDVPVRAAVKFDQLGHELGLQQTPWAAPPPADSPSRGIRKAPQTQPGKQPQPGKQRRPRAAP